MGHGIYTALSGALAQQRALEVISNNVANTNTVGFRADRVSFKASLGRQIQGTPDRAQRYVEIDGVTPENWQGRMEETGNKLDVALMGQGFLAVEGPGGEGERYTRAGHMVVDNEGTLRTIHGRAVRGEGGSISVPPDVRDIVIKYDGEVLLDGESAGKLKVVEFADPSRLQKEGATLFVAPEDMPPQEAENTQVMQGNLEYPSHNGVAGVTGLITVSRQFAAFQRLIKTFQQLDERAARNIVK